MRGIAEVCEVRTWQTTPRQESSILGLKEKEKYEKIYLYCVLQTVVGKLWSSLKF